MSYIVLRCTCNNYMYFRKFINYLFVFIRRYTSNIVWCWTLIQWNWLKTIVLNKKNFIYYYIFYWIRVRTFLQLCFLKYLYRRRLVFIFHDGSFWLWSCPFSFVRIDLGVLFSSLPASTSRIIRTRIRTPTMEVVIYTEIKRTLKGL